MSDEERVGDPAAVARRRLRAGLLAWGGPRPRVPDGLATELRARLEDGLAGLDLAAAVRGRRDGRLLLTRSRLARAVCDGYQLDPEPFQHSGTNVRGLLARKAIERDWELRRTHAVDAVVASAWRELASDRPGDPRSLAAWLNACGEEEASGLRDEVAVLLDGFREVWPELDGVEVVARPRIRLPLAGGRVVLSGRPDVLLSSPVRDERCRTLLVDLKTSRPRSEHDRHELRFHALLATLRDGRPPFRWATYYVPEGRSEWEELSRSVLEATVERVLDTARQAARLAVADEQDLELVAGDWCRFCLREATCGVAAAARSSQQLGA